MKQTLKQTTEFFATTIVEAEGIVEDMKQKHAASVINHSITRKVKSTKEVEFEYFVVKVTVQHVTIKELLEDLV